MKKVAAAAVGALALLATTAPVFAQGKIFPDVPDEHWAADAVKMLSNNGIVIGYPDGTYKGVAAMSRYEFAMAISRLLPLINKEIEDAIAKIVIPPQQDLGPYEKTSDLNNTLRGFVTTDQLNAAINGIHMPDLSGYDTKADVDIKIAALRNEIQTIQASLDNLRDQFKAMGVDVDKLKAEYAGLDARVSELEKLRVSGTATAFVKTSAQYFGGARGQYSAGIDIDRALLDNGTDPNSGAVPGFGNASGKNGLFSNPSALYDTQLSVSYSPDNKLRAVAEFIMGNYYSAWHEAQAFSAAFPNAAAGSTPLLSNRQAGSIGLETYLAYLAMPIHVPGTPTSDRAGVQAGRFATQMTPYTWWAVDPDTYVNIAREDSGQIALTGASLSGNAGQVGYSLWGGYDPTDGTDPSTFGGSGVDPSRAGTIGFGHYNGPGGNYSFSQLNYPNTGPGSNGSRTHLDPTSYSIPTLQTAAGAHIGLPWIGLNYVMGLGDDWHTQISNVSPITSPYNRFGQVWSVDWNTSWAANKLVSFLPAFGFQGETAFSQTNDWGAYGVQTRSGNGLFVPSTSGHAVDYKLTFPIGFTRWMLGGKNISQSFNAPGAWGQLGSWINPWNYTSDSPLYVKVGQSMDASGTGAWHPNYEVPVIPTDIGFTAPFHNVPLLGDLGFTVTDGVGHMSTDNGLFATPISPTTMANIAHPELFRITHASAGLNFSAGQKSDWQFGVSSESVLRDYPITSTFGADTTSMWQALKSLVNVRGGSGTAQSAPNRFQLGLGEGVIQSDENYYKVTIGKKLTADGSAFAKLTLSRIVYNDRSSDNLSPATNGPGNGGGSYRGAVGVFQVGYHF